MYTQASKQQHIGMNIYLSMVQVLLVKAYLKENNEQNRRKYKRVTSKRTLFNRFFSMCILCYNQNVSLFWVFFSFVLILHFLLIMAKLVYMNEQYNVS